MTTRTSIVAPVLRRAGIQRPRRTRSGTVRVAVEAASVGFATLMMVAGTHQNKSTPPFVPATELTFTMRPRRAGIIASVAAERIARVTLELGGKSPAIVTEDFPTEAAAKILGRTITVLSGQVCAMLSRAIVPAHRAGEIAEAIAAETSANARRFFRLDESRTSSSSQRPLAA